MRLIDKIVATLLKHLLKVPLLRIIESYFLFIIHFREKSFKQNMKTTTASASGLFDYDLNHGTRNNGAKLIVKHFNTSVARHFYPIKITTTWNAYQVKL